MDAVDLELGNPIFCLNMGLNEVTLKLSQARKTYGGTMGTLELFFKESVRGVDGRGLDRS